MVTQPITCLFLFIALLSATQLDLGFVHLPCTESHEADRILQDKCMLFTNKKAISGE